MSRFHLSDRFKSDESDRWYEYGDTNPYGETILVHIIDIKDEERSLGWYECGMTDSVLESYMDVTTYVQRGGNIYGGYNPTCHLEGVNYMLDTEWLMEAGEENRVKVLDEIERRFTNGVHR
jgi:hypothetical protein